MTTMTSDLRMPVGENLLGEAWDAVVRLVLEESDATLEPASIRPETSLREELALGSLQAIEMIMRVEDEYHINFGDEELAGLRTVGDVVQLVNTKLAARGEGAEAP